MTEERSLKEAVEDCENFSVTNKAYRDVLKHRKTCPKWAKEFCLECFGGGLTRFTKEAFRSQKSDLLAKVMEILTDYNIIRRRNGIFIESSEDELKKRIKAI